MIEVTGIREQNSTPKEKNRWNDVRIRRLRITGGWTVAI